MAVEEFRHHFFNVLKEYKNDPTGEILYSDEGRKQMHEEALPFFDALPKDFTTLLDAGCGAGYDSAYFQKIGKKVTAITANATPAQKQFAQKEGFNIQNMDMCDLKFDDNTFDAVLCKHSLEHSFSPLGCLYEIRRILRGGGVFVPCRSPAPSNVNRIGAFYTRLDTWSGNLFISCNWI